MLIDLIGDAPAWFLVVGAAMYGGALTWMVAREIECARWRREFGGWRPLPRGIDRIAATAWCALMQGGAALLERMRLHRRDGRYGWRVLQRHRIALRRDDRGAW